MNSVIRFNSASLFAQAVTVLELDATPEYELDGLEIHTNDEYGITAILEDNGIFMFEVESNDEDESLPGEDMDGDHASALASVYGDNEDCGMSMYDDRCDCGD